MSGKNDDKLTAAALSSGLARIFRGRFCEVLLLPRRALVSFDRDDVLYDLGDDQPDLSAIATLLGVDQPTVRTVLTS